MFVQNQGTRGGNKQQIKLDQSAQSQIASWRPCGEVQVPQAMASPPYKCVGQDTTANQQELRRDSPLVRVQPSKSFCAISPVTPSIKARDPIEVFLSLGASKEFERSYLASFFIRNREQAKQEVKDLGGPSSLLYLCATCDCSEPPLLFVCDPRERSGSC
jgi:hypothetical protein